MFRALVLLAVTSACGRVGFATTDTSDGVLGESPSCLGPSGLVAYYALDADSIAGTTVLDRSGNHRDTTIVGTVPKSIPGMIGGALDFAQTTTTYVDASVVPISGTVTIAMWYRNDDPTVDQALASFPIGPTPANPPRYDIWLNQSRTGTASLCINTGENDCWGVAETPARPLLGRWVHVVAVIASGLQTGGRLYVDGEPVAMSCVFGACTNTRTVMSPLQLVSSDSEFAWRGLLDEVRVYDRALDDTEAHALFACR